jgi:hypothetical protein
MTFIHLLSRMSVLNPEISPSHIFKDKYQELPQYVLMNPHGHGEGLRAMTYPLEIYRKVEVPRAWLAQKEFLEIRSHFFSRFVMSYHEREDNKFEICTRSSCEVTGEGLEEFKNLFNQQEEKNAQ